MTAAPRDLRKSITQFFSWWFRELNEAFAGRTKPPLALLLANREVALIERGASEPWQVVDLSAPDRRTRIEGLRSTAERRAGGVAAVEVRLPVEQVHFTTLPAPLDVGHGAEAEIAVATKLPRDTLLIVSSKPRRDKGGGMVRDFAVTLRSSVADALRHSREWGFVPARVTSSHWPTAFPEGPNFLSSRVKRTTPLRRKLLLALLIATPFGIAAAGAHVLGEREALARMEDRSAERMPVAPFDRARAELRLAELANRLSVPVEARTDTTPMWYIFGLIGEMLPPDVAIENLQIDRQKIRIVGDGVGYDRLISALNAAPQFEGTTLRDSRAGRGATASFVIETNFSGREG